MKFLMIKNFRSQTLLYAIVVGLERVVSFFLLSYLTNVVSQEEIAIWYQIIVTVGILTPLVSMGLVTAIIKYMPIYESNLEIRDSTIFVMILLILGVFILFSASLIYFNQFFSYLIYGNIIYFKYIFLLIIFILIETLFDFCVNIFRYKNFIFTISIYIFLKSFSRILTFIFCISIIGLDFYLSLFYLALLQFFFIIFLYSSFFFRKSLMNINLKKGIYKMNEILSFSLPLVIYSILVALNNFSDRYFLAHFKNLNDLSVYSTVSALTNSISFFYIILCFNLFPTLSKYFSKNNKQDFDSLSNKVIQSYLSLCLPSVVGLSILGPSLILIFFNENYIVPFYILVILSFNIALFGLFQIITQVIVLIESSILVVKIMFFSCFVNLMLNFILIPKFGLLGAAISGLVSNLILIINVIYLLKKLINFNFFSFDLFKITLNSILLLCFLLILMLWLNFYNQLHLFFSIIFASIFYISIDRYCRKNSIFRF
jgi:O-antigen/teichoic acid export membrane protein